jgi:hypothetical protein
MKFRIHNHKPVRHLTDEEFALWVDAVSEDHPEKLPEWINAHVEECLECKEKIIEISQSVKVSQTSETEDADRIFRQKFRPVPIIHLSAAIKLAVAALVIIGIGLLVAKYFIPKKQDPSELFAQNFTPYPDVITEKSSLWPVDSLHQWLTTGLGFYQEKKYDSAYVVFSHINQRFTANDTILFYYANTILSTGSNLNIAIDILELLTEKENPFREASKWYLSLALIKNNDPKGAEKYLISLVSSSDYYREKAEVLLKRLQ